MNIPSLSKLPQYLSNRNIASIILFVMLTQFVYIEGYSISPVKVGLMTFMPVIFFIKVPYVSKALILGIIYLLTITFSGLFHPESFRFSTIGYLGMFVITFITLYNLIYSGAFTLTYFIKFLKWMILAYSICLILQQLFVLVGIRFMPMINLDNQFFLSIIKLPSLSLEPSHSARIIGTLMYAYMECNWIIQGSAFKFNQLFEQKHKWVTYGFLWAMLTMGSGTAFIVIGILSLYFINWRNALIIVPLLIGLIFVGSTLDIKQLNRILTIAETAMTLDNNKISKTDNSASYRIGPIVNTINNLDLNKKEHWFGYGIDSGVGLENKSTVMIAEITDYGFLSYLCGLILIFTCSIRFWSISTIMYFIGIGGGTANVAYGWGILMIFTCVRYFYENNHNATINNEQADTCHLHV